MLEGPCLSWQKTADSWYMLSLIMVLKLFCRKPSNLITFATNIFLRRNLSSNPSEPTNNLKYLLVLDFEATCEKKKKIEVQEIIEFPCLKVNFNTLEEEGRFHYYVKPIENPLLSDFCVQLTGILQEMVDDAPLFPEVYKEFEEWRNKEGITAQNSLYVTSGDWDLGHMIKVQCQLSGLPRPPHMRMWADLKKIFGNNVDIFHSNLSDILKHFGLVFEGRLHSGIDDCLNMLRIMRKMREAGMEFKPTSTISTKTLRVVNLCASSKVRVQGLAGFIS